jgi:hypothetical protein
MSGAVRMDRRLYLTADGSRVVEDGDPEASTLLCAAGGEVPHAVAARLGLLPEPESQESNTAAEGDGEEKARSAPSNKARTRAPNKAS